MAANAGGIWSPPAHAWKGQSGEPWSIRLRSGQTAQRPSAATAASPSGTASERRCRRAPHAASATTAAAGTTAVVFVPTDRPAASNTNGSSAGRSTLATASAPAATSHVSAGRSVPTEFSAPTTSGSVAIAAVPSATVRRSQPRPRSPAHAAQTSRTSSSGAATIAGAHEPAIAVGHASSTSCVSG